MSIRSRGVIYVAGPFRGPNAWAIEQNIRRAEALALEAWQAGFAVICPHTNTRFFQGTAPDEVWLIGDLDLVARCDAVLMVPGWQQSCGATGERGHATTLGIPVFETLEDLCRHFPPS